MCVVVRSCRVVWSPLSGLRCLVSLSGLVRPSCVLRVTVRVTVVPVGKDCAVQPASLPFDVPVIRQVSLTRLLGEVARAVAEIGRITVEGEVHRPTTSAANRTYFVLRDRSAQLSVAVPASRQRFCRVRDGERVAVTGSIEMQIDRGQLQLVAHEVAPVGFGAIAQMIAEARERLRVEGVLDRPRRLVPMLPTCIGVLCGTEAAVRKDIESVVASRFPGYPVVFLETIVSGPGAVESLLTALSMLQRDQHVDVIVLARGGGDATQLLPFSDEGLCRAIAASRVPIVSAIGHDGDRPLSDDVADVRAGTPSIAASMVVPDRAALTGRIVSLEDAIGRAYERRIERSTQRVQSVPWQTALDRRVDRARERLSRIDRTRAVDGLVRRSTDRLSSIDWHRGVAVRAASSHARLTSLHAQVAALSPARVLERGYAVVRTANGDVVRDAGAVVGGALLDIRVAQGAFFAVASVATADRSDGKRNRMDQR